MRIFPTENQQIADLLRRSSVPGSDLLRSTRQRAGRGSGRHCDRFGISQQRACGCPASYPASRSCDKSGFACAIDFATQRRAVCGVRPCPARQSAAACACRHTTVCDV